MLKNKTERYLIQKMAELATQYQEPYDERDTTSAENNQPLEYEYSIYKNMLKELCGF